MIKIIITIFWAIALICQIVWKVLTRKKHDFDVNENSYYFHEDYLSRRK